MQFALVAGGSKGIGYAIAEALARRKYNLVLVGRHPDTLTKAKTTLEQTYPIEVKTYPADMGVPGAAEELGAWCQMEQLPIAVLCTVAGLGGKEDYLTLPLEDLRYMVSLNLSGPMAICLSLLPVLERNAPAHILTVGSMAGFAPIPEKNLYSATKAAVISFSYSLRYQLKAKRISVSCLCPGPVFTKPEIREDTLKKLGLFGKWMAVAPAAVGEAAVSGMLAGHMIIVPGVLSKIMSLVLRLLPARVISYIYFKVGQKKS